MRLEKLHLDCANEGVFPPRKHTTVAFTPHGRLSAGIFPSRLVPTQTDAGTRAAGGTTMTQIIVEPRSTVGTVTQADQAVNLSTVTVTVQPGKDWTAAAAAAAARRAASG